MTRAFARSSLGLVGVAIICATVLADASARRMETEAIPPGPIKIGMPVAVTGGIALFDGDNVTGARTAAHDINAKGGVLKHKIVIVTGDTHSDIAQGATAALEVIGKGAQFLIPTLDYNFGGGAARVGNSKHLVTISGAGDLRFGLGIGPYVFNLYPGDPTEAAVLATYTRKYLHWKRAYLLDDVTTADDQGVCRDFGSIFQQLGGQVTGSDQFQQSDQSIATQITRLRGSLSQIDGIMLCSYPPGGSSAMRQLRGSGITKPIALTTSFDGNSWEAAVPNVGKVYIASVGPLTPGQQGSATVAGIFRRAEKLAGKPNTFAQGLLQGYSAVQAIADAIKKTKTVSGSRIKAYLETFRNKSLAIGPTTWTPRCHARAGDPFIIATVVNGQEHFVKRLAPAKLPAHSCG